MDEPTIVIEVIEAANGNQRWRYLVSDAGNHAAFEKPTERYSEERGALSAIEQVHGPDAVVLLRRKGHDDVILRRPQTTTIELTDEQTAAVIARIWGDNDDPRIPGVVEKVITAINAARA